MTQGPPVADLIESAGLGKTPEFLEHCAGNRFAEFQDHVQRIGAAGAAMPGRDSSGLGSSPLEALGAGLSNV
jgi:hypothetical protein